MNESDARGEDDLGSGAADDLGSGAADVVCF